MIGYLSTCAAMLYVDLLVQRLLDAMTPVVGCSVRRVMAVGEEVREEKSVDAGLVLDRGGRRCQRRGKLNVMMLLMAGVVFWWSSFGRTHFHASGHRKLPCSWDLDANAWRKA